MVETMVEIWVEASEHYISCSRTLLTLRPVFPTLLPFECLYQNCDETQLSVTKLFLITKPIVRHTYNQNLNGKRVKAPLFHSNDTRQIHLTY